MVSKYSFADNWSRWGSASCQSNRDPHYVRELSTQFITQFTVLLSCNDRTFNEIVWLRFMPCPSSIIWSYIYIYIENRWMIDAWQSSVNPFRIIVFMSIYTFLHVLILLLGWLWWTLVTFMACILCDLYYCKRIQWTIPGDRFCSIQYNIFIPAYYERYPRPTLYIFNSIPVRLNYNLEITRSADFRSYLWKVNPSLGRCILLSMFCKQ